MFQPRTLSRERSEEIRNSRGFTLQGAEAQCALAFVLFAAGAAFSGNPAYASSLNGEGPFAANFVGYAEADIPPLETVSGRSIGIVNSTLTAMNAENAAFLDNRTGRCLGTWEIDPVSSTFEEHVHCTYTDDDGDRIFERADFDRQTLGGPASGTGRWLGGTGKYEGLSGVFEIHVRTLRSAREGLIQYVGTKQGRYRLRPSEP